jgi:hypothetical protein
MNYRRFILEINGTPSSMQISVPDTQAPTDVDRAAKIPVCGFSSAKIA